jgi:DNA-binding transcriptional LysR family regulator
MQSWDLIRAFLALHRAGTFEGAAHLLGVDDSTLRRRVQSLEQQSGEALFIRKDGRYEAPPKMRSLVEAAMRMEVSSRAFFEAAAGRDGGVVRVTMIDVFAGWLAPDLAVFQSLHPQIQLDITTEHHFVDLERDMVDVAVRMARPTKGASRLRKLGEISYGVYAAPAYLDARAQAAPDAPHDLLTLSIHFMRGDHDFLAGETAWAMERLPPGRIVCAADSYLALRELCEAGMGLALMPEVLAEGRGGLVRISDDGLGACDLWLVVHGDTGTTPRVKLFTDFIGQVFRRRLARPPAPALTRMAVAR